MPKNVVLKINAFLLYNISWFTWKPIMRLKRMGVYMQNTHFSAATHPSILNFVPH